MYHQPSINHRGTHPINCTIDASWKSIAPFWPLDRLVAVNPLHGYISGPIEQVMPEYCGESQQKDWPKPMLAINRETIKWMQAFCDQGQATIPMPLRTQGLYGAWKKLAFFDERIHKNDPKKRQFLAQLPECSQDAISLCLTTLAIDPQAYTAFVTLIIDALPGWASYVQYLACWKGDDQPHPMTQSDYTAVRLIITCLLWDNAGALLEWMEELPKTVHNSRVMRDLEQAEKEHLMPLLAHCSQQKTKKIMAPSAQIVFCIDVRSEPLRRALEQAGPYETWSCSGFFGLPVEMYNPKTKQYDAACPVFVQPKHRLQQVAAHDKPLAFGIQSVRDIGHTIKSIYQSIFKNFATSPVFINSISGFICLWMTLKTFAPQWTSQWRGCMTGLLDERSSSPLLMTMPLADQCAYGEAVLRTMGMTQGFAPLVVLCGHGAGTENNAYSAFLQCVACGGHPGGGNGRMMAKILNNAAVRGHLAQGGIVIPESTLFMGAEHNTTRDSVIFYAHDAPTTPVQEQCIADLQDAFAKAGAKTRANRAKTLGDNQDPLVRGQDWAQIRPEWGAAGNRFLIIAPREITREMDLGGHAFLHSYDCDQDGDGSFLSAILKSPLSVVHWINSQYLFSTLNHEFYGSGNKTTINITGKMGFMQGNASDLMTGLPLQAIDTHIPVRLMVVVRAPCAMIDKIIGESPTLSNLLRHGWILFSALDPQSNQTSCLQRDLTWTDPFSIAY